MDMADLGEVIGTAANHYGPVNDSLLSASLRYDGGQSLQWYVDRNIIMPAYEKAGMLIDSSYTAAVKLILLAACAAIVAGVAITYFTRK